MGHDVRALMGLIRVDHLFHLGFRFFQLGCFANQYFSWGRDVENRTVLSPG